MRRYLVVDLEPEDVFSENKWSIVDTQTNLLLTNEEGSVIDYQHLFDAEIAEKELNDPANLNMNIKTFLIEGVKQINANI